MNTASTIGAGIIVVPLILSGIGIAGYGIWTLARTFSMYAGLLSQGMEPAVQRYVSSATAHRDENAVSAVIWTSLIGYSGFGAVLGGLMVLAAPWLVRAFSIPIHLEDDALVLFRTTGAALFIGMAAAALLNILQGLQRYSVVMAIDMSSVAAMVLGVAYFTLLEPSLIALGFVLLSQQVLLLIARGLALRGDIRRPRLLPRADSRRLASFSGQLQISSMSLIVSTQTDKLILGVIGGPAVVAQVAIGAQIAESVRVFQYSALTPLTTHLASTWASSREAALRIASRVFGQWHSSVVGLSLLLSCSMFPIVLAWVGSDHEAAAGYGVMLTIAYSAYLWPSAVFVLRRVQQRPGLEIRFAVLSAILNVIGSMLAGIVFGPVGVVAATTVANLTAVVWVSVAARKDAEELPKAAHLLSAPTVFSAAAIAVAVGGLGLICARVLPQGFALVPVGLLFLAGLLVISLLTGLIGRGELVLRLRSSYSRLIRLVD